MSVKKYNYNILGKINLFQVFSMVAFLLYVTFAFMVLAWGYARETGYKLVLSDGNFGFIETSIKFAGYFINGFINNPEFFRNIIYKDAIYLLLIFYLLFTFLFIKKAIFLGSGYRVQKMPFSQLFFYIFFIVESILISTKHEAALHIQSLVPPLSGNGPSWLLWLLKTFVIAGFVLDIVVNIKRNRHKPIATFIYIFCLVISNLILLTFAVYGMEMVYDMFRGSVQLMFIMILGNIFVFLTQSGLLEFLFLTDIAMHDRSEYWRDWWW